MGEKFDQFMNLDIPEEMYLSRNIQATRHMPPSRVLQRRTPPGLSLQSSPAMS